MRTLALISLAAMAFALWDHYDAPSLPLERVPEEAFTATSAQDAQQDMQWFMDLGLVTRTKQLKREVLVDRAVWERIEEEKRERFARFAAEYFRYTSMGQGRHATIRDESSGRVLDPG